MPGSVMKGQEFVVNSNGVRIKMCCASCEHKVSINHNDFRKCELSGKKVTKDFLCRDWHISAYFDKLRVGRNK